MFFGSINLFGLGVIAEYIGKIFEETKQRPLFLRRNIIKDGEVRDAASDMAAEPKRIS
jgi:polyisoprenyl-phosphate glycosyltransferase